MVIQIDGINTQNKGAELMLVAILEEITLRVPDATIYLNPNGILDFSILPIDKLDVRQRFFLKYGKLVRKILYKLHVPNTYFTHFYAMKGIDLMIDASGFQFSDQWKHSEKNLKLREKYYKTLKSFNTKIVLLPQAFGPFETSSGKRSVEIVSNNFDLIFARELQSYDYLIKAGGDQRKIVKSCDFTFKVKGIVPEQYKFLEGAVCIIPNKKMITHADNGKSEYLDLLNNIIDYFEASEKKVFLLNHEGLGDEQLCRDVNSLRVDKLDILTNLTAKEVKGVIGNSNIVVSSRFHGVASALSQGVPCLATSWNHKYEMLFNDFGQQNSVLKANEDWTSNRDRIAYVVNNYDLITSQLKTSKVKLIKVIDNMWNKLFK